MELWLFLASTVNLMVEEQIVGKVKPLGQLPPSNLVHLKGLLQPLGNKIQMTNLLHHCNK